MRWSPPSSAKHERLGSELREARKRAGLTQVTVAVWLGKPQSFVAKVENGERRLETLEFVEYCRLVQEDPLALLGRMIDEN